MDLVVKNVYRPYAYEEEHRAVSVLPSLWLRRVRGEVITRDASVDATVLPMPIRSDQSDLSCGKEMRATFGTFNIERMRLGEADLEGISHY